MKKILSILLGLSIALLFGAPNIILAQSGGVLTEGGCLTGFGQGCMSVSTIIGLKDQQPDYTPTSIAQDVVMAATYYVGAVLTFVIIVCGLGYVFASGDGKDTSKYKKGLIYAGIGALLVRGAYAIVRLIQYIARSS